MAIVLSASYFIGHARGQAVQPPSGGNSEKGAAIYAQNCAVCHAGNLRGNPPHFPSLVGITHEVSTARLFHIVRTGLGLMPPFSQSTLSDSDLNALLHFLAASAGQTSRQAVTSPSTALVPQIARGNSIFQQNCSFCHGRDAAGGNTGPDLTRSALVEHDVNGSSIGAVVRNGRPQRGMPGFQFDDVRMADLVDFLHYEAKLATMGNRRGVDASDLTTGNASRGKMFFFGAGNCAHCHSPSGDLAGVADRYSPLQLELRMLYPRDIPKHATVTSATGQTVQGTLVFVDEFTVAVRDAEGNYHAWRKENVQCRITDPVQAHIALLSRYTDPEIHDALAYLLTLHASPHK
jgi:mono/diheme cytochrome c family protein